MAIMQIQFKKGNVTVAYGDYDIMITAKQEAWFRIDQDGYRQFRLLLDVQHEQERRLEQRHRLPIGCLRGTYLVFGSHQNMRESLEEELLKYQIRNGLIKFYIKIVTETGQVSTYCQEHPSEEMRLYRRYRLTHNFFNPRGPPWQ